MRKRKFLSVLTTSFLAASMLAMPTISSAKPKIVSNVVTTEVAIESTKLLNHQGEEIKIARDGYGVPHVYAETDSALFFGAGFATAEDRLWQAELSRIVSSGRMAEVFGPGEGNKNIGQDMVIRRDGYTDEEAMAQFERLPDYVKRGLLGYIDGINHYIESTPLSQMPLEFQGQGRKPQLWTVLDSLKIQQLMVRRFGESGGGEMETFLLLETLKEKFKENGLEVFNTVRWSNDPTARVSLNSDTDKSVKKTSNKPGGVNFQKVDEVAKQLEKEQQMKLDIEKAFGFPHKGGSNAWVVSPSLSESGGTLLLGGPQMGFSAPQIAHEVGIHGAGYNSVGMAFAGAGPIPLIGRGNDFAWTTTTGYGDQIDTFMLAVNPENPNQYSYKGKWIDFEVRIEKINVRVSSDKVQTNNYPVYRSVHGPVVYKDNKIAYSQKRSHWGQEVEAMVGFYDFNRARNIKQFEEATQKIPTSHNFLYSDKQGNIGYWITGRNPIRANGTDNRLPMNGDGSQDWQGIASPETLPHAINPAQGYVANWNNKPSPDWESTEALFGPTHRVGFILNQLDGLEKVSWSDMEEINKKAGHIHLDAYFFKNLLLSKLNFSEDTSGDVKLAAELVRDWDMYQFDEDNDKLYDKPGLTIFNSWFKNVKETVFAQLEGTKAGSNDLLYHVLNADASELEEQFWFLGNLNLDEIALDSLENAVTELSESETYKEYPQEEWLSPIKLIKFSSIGAGTVDPILNMNRGTYNQIVEFTKRDTRSVNILPPGQSGDVRSKHFDDQRSLYANWEYKQMVLDILKPNKK